MWPHRAGTHLKPCYERFSEFNVLNAWTCKKDRDYYRATGVRTVMLGLMGDRADYHRAKEDLPQIPV